MCFYFLHLGVYDSKISLSAELSKKHDLLIIRQKSLDVSEGLTKRHSAHVFHYDGDSDECDHFDYDDDCSKTLHSFSFRYSVNLAREVLKTSSCLL